MRALSPRAATALPRQPLSWRTLRACVLRRCPRAPSRPAGFDKAAAEAEAAGGAGAGDDAGGDDAERAHRDEREAGGSESDSDDGLPPLEANMNRHRAGGGGHRVTQADSDEDSD